MRNVIAHDYDDVDYDVLWATISMSVPQFAAALGTEPRSPTIAAEPESPAPDIENGLGIL